MPQGNATSFINTATLPEVTDLIKKEFYTVGEMVRPVAAQLFIQDNLTSWPHPTKRYDEYDVKTFAQRKHEGVAAKKTQAGIGYRKTMESFRYATEIEITWEMRRYGQDKRFASDVKNLAHFLPQRKELDLSHRFTFANATSYTSLEGETIDVSTGDDLAMVSTVHTLAHSATTYSNQVSGNPIFSQGALELAEELTVSNILSNFGEKRVMNFNTIVTSDDPTTCRAVRQVLESTADVDAAHAGVMNYYGGSYSHVKLPYLATDASGARNSAKKKWWFLVAANQGMAGWQAYFSVFESDNMKAPDEDTHTDNWHYGVRGSWGIVVLSGRGVVASLAS